MLRVIRNTAGIATVLAAFSAPAFAFTVDGRLSPGDNYQLSFDATFTFGSTNVTGGKLYFGTDNGPGGTGDHYMLFAFPKGFVDNTYGANAIGWPSPKGHSFKDLLKSDSLGTGGGEHGAAALPLTLKPVNTGGATLDLIVDYLASDVTKGSSSSPTVFASGGIGDPSLPGDNQGAVLSGDASGVKEIATSLEYNIATYGAADVPNGYDPATATGVIKDSPATDSSYTPNPAFPDWVFDVAYEFRFDAAMFDERWIDPNQALNFVMLTGAHASPSKTGQKSPDSITFTQAGGPPPSQVPEPGALVLFAMGLLGIAWTQRRREARRVS